jgi:hypothetical protein
MAQKVAIKGSYPAKIIEDETAAPKVKLPSTVKSGKSITLKVMYTPIATKEYNNPISSAPSICN